MFRVPTKDGICTCRSNRRDNVSPDHSSYGQSPDGLTVRLPPPPRPAFLLPGVDQHPWHVIFSPGWFFWRGEEGGGQQVTAPADTLITHVNVTVSVCLLRFGAARLLCA